MPEEKNESTVEYIMKGPSYVAMVKRANLVGYTFLPPYDHGGRPRPMNTLDRFLAGGWRKCSWEDYASKGSAKSGRAKRLRHDPGAALKRRVTLAFIGALLADIALTFIIWLSLMMVISVFDLETKWGLQVDSFKLLFGTFCVLFVLLFLGFVLFIKPQKTAS
ncbi:MAG: hypothetical protein PVG35_13835 [Desulfobacterales bacterium]